MKNFSENFYKFALKLDVLLDNPSNENIIEIKKIIKDESLLQYFIRELIAKNNYIDWLIPLCENNFFNLNKMTNLYEVGNENNNYYWIIFNYIEKVSEYINNLNDSENKIEYFTVINNIIKPVIYKLKSEKNPQISYTYYLLIKIIYFLPYSFVNIDYLNFIENAIITNPKLSIISHEICDVIIVRLINNKNKKALLDLLNIILKFKNKEKSEYEKLKPLIDNYYLAKLLKDYNKVIFNICGEEIIHLVISSFREAVEVDNSNFSVVRIPSVEDSKLRWRFDSYEESLFDFLRNLLMLVNEKDIIFYIKEFLYEKNVIFHRLLIFLIDINYNTCSHFFWENFYLFIMKYELKHEIYLLLKNNCHNFSDELIDFFISYIDENNFYSNSELSGEEVEKINVNLKKEWLTSLNKIENENVKKLKTKYENINESKIEHPGEVFWHSGPIFGYGKSPITEDELSTYDVEKLVLFLNEFKEEIGIKDITKEGLSTVLNTVISKDIYKYLNEIDKFYNCEFIYIKSVINAILKSYESYLEMDLIKVVNFVKKLSEKKNFWFINYKDYNYLIIEEITDFVEKNTKDDNKKFDEEIFNVLGELLILFLQNIKTSDDNESKDIPTLMINSTRGKLLIACMNYCLQYARTNNNSQNKWLISFKNEFTKRLDKSFDNSLEFSGILGWYLPQLTFLDNEWVNNYFNEIFPMEIDKHWEAAMSTFLFYNNTIYKDIFNKFKQFNHFTKAINFNFKSEQVKERLVEYIAFSYIQGWDDLSPQSLMKKFIDSRNPKLLSHLVRFYWQFKKDFRYNSEYLRELWSYLTKKIEPFLNEKDFKLVLSDLITWMYFFENIDEEMFEWLKCSANNIDSNYNLGNLISLSKDKLDSYPLEMSELLLIGFQKQVVDIYDEEDILPIISKLYLYQDQTKIKENTNKICNFLGSKGFYFLKDLYKENNKNF